MKKNLQVYEEVTMKDLEEKSGGIAWTTIIPISAAVCPTTKCASITRPCV